jgi:hypothetical protein
MLISKGGVIKARSGNSSNNRLVTECPLYLGFRATTSNTGCIGGSNCWGDGRMSVSFDWTMRRWYASNFSSSVNKWNEIEITLDGTLTASSRCSTLIPDTTHGGVMGWSWNQEMSGTIAMSPRTIEYYIDTGFEYERIVEDNVNSPVGGVYPVLGTYIGDESCNLSYPPLPATTCQCNLLFNVEENVTWVY